MIVKHNFPKEHLPLTLEARLGSQAPGSEVPTLQVSLPGSLCAQYVWEPVQQEDKVLPSWDSCSYGDGCNKEGDILAVSLRSWCLIGSEWHEGGGHATPGGGDLRQGVLRKELTWQIGGTAGRPVCLRRVSRRIWREMVPEQWAVSLEVGLKPWMVQSRQAMCSYPGVKIFLWWSLEGRQQKQLEVLVKLRRQKCGLRIGYQFLELL